MRTARRPRRGVDRAVLRGLSPLFQYSDSREAWMLRGVGRWVGPVLVPREEMMLPEAAPTTTASFQPARRRFERVRRDRETSTAPLRSTRGRDTGP